MAAATLLTTWRCLHQRHPDLSRGQVEAMLRASLAAERVLWLDHGYLKATIPTRTSTPWPGSHRTTPSCSSIATTRPTGTTPNSKPCAGELQALRTADGRPYRLHALPWAAPILDQGRRLAASYANYLVVNDAVLVPAYDDPSDAVAAAVIGAAHPGRRVVPIPCRALIWQNGSLHCVTMQLPHGAAAAPA